MLNGIKRAYTLLILFLIEVIEAQGTDISLKMLQNAIEKQADIIHDELFKEISKEEDPIKIGDKVYRAFMEEAGAEVIAFEENDCSITFRVRHCPFFEAFLDVGINCGYFLGGLCTNFTLPAIQAILVRFNERLRIDTRLIRETSEEYCLERLFLKG